MCLKCNKLIYIIMFAAYFDCSTKVENGQSKKQYLSSAKLMLVSIISQIEVSIFYEL